MKLALAQMRVIPGKHSVNLDNATDHIRAAAIRGAEIVLLPEAMDLGWTHSSARKLAAKIPSGSTAQRLIQAARDNNIYVCSGLVERENQHLFNSALLISPKGRILLHHRKIHELDFAKKLYRTGSALKIAETPWGRIGLMICADAFIAGEVISRTLVAMGARVILSPCAWAVPPDFNQTKNPYGQLWRSCYGKVTRTHPVFIAGVSNVGPITTGEWRGHACIGNSLVVGPGANVVVQGNFGVDAEEMRFVDLDW